MTTTEELPIVKYSIADAEIANLSADYLPLYVSGVEDKEGFEIVHLARLDVKEKRIGVEKMRVALKADALRYGKAVDGEAKRLTALLDPIERHLERQETVYTAEVERKKAEKKAEEEARLQRRISASQAVDAPISLAEMKIMSDADFAEFLKVSTAKWAEKQAVKKAEQEAAAKVAAEQDAERLALAKALAEAEFATHQANAAKAQAEKAIRDAQEAERAAAARVQAEKDKAAAVDRAKVEEAARIQAESEVKAKREAELVKAEAERKAKEETLRPARETIKRLAAIIRTEALSLPTSRLGAKANRIALCAAQELFDLANGKDGA